MTVCTAFLALHFLVSFSVRPATASRVLFGYQPGVEVCWQIDRRAYLQGDYGIFYAGPFLRQTMPGRNLNYLSFWAGYEFQRRASFGAERS